MLHRLPTVWALSNNLRPMPYQL